MASRAPTDERPDETHDPRPMRRYVVPTAQALRWFRHFGREPPDELLEQDRVILIEVKTAGASLLFATCFACVMVRRKVTRLLAYPQASAELMLDPLPQHNPAYLFNETFLEMRKGFVFERMEDDRASRGAGESEDAAAARAVAHRVLRLLRKNFVRRGAVGLAGETHEWVGRRLSVALVLQLIAALEAVVESEPTLVPLHPPVCVLGDLSGSYLDAVSVFEGLQMVPNAAFTPDTFLMLGRVVAGGPHPLEVFCLTAALKVLCPKNVFTLNPQHRWGELERTGFAALAATREAVAADIGDRRVFAAMMRVVSNYPQAALIDNAILCVSEGIPRRLVGERQLLHALATFPRKTYDEVAPIDDAPGRGGAVRDTDVLAAAECQFVIRGRRGDTVGGARLTRSGTSASARRGGRSLSGASAWARRRS